MTHVRAATAPAVPDGPLSLAGKARLGAEVVRTTRASRAVVEGGDVRAALAVLRDGPLSCGRPAPWLPVERLARATRRVVPLVPGDSRCLVQSLTLAALLARRGVHGTVVIGVQPGGDVLDAHAWVEVDGRPLLPTNGFPRLVEL